MLCTVREMPRRGRLDLEPLVSGQVEVLEILIEIPGE